MQGIEREEVEIDGGREGITEGKERVTSFLSLPSFPSQPLSSFSFSFSPSLSLFLSSYLLISSGIVSKEAEESVGKGREGKGEREGEKEEGEKEREGGIEREGEKE